MTMIDQAATTVGTTAAEVLSASRCDLRWLRVNVWSSTVVRATLIFRAKGVERTITFDSPGSVCAVGDQVIVSAVSLTGADARTFVQVADHDRWVASDVTLSDVYDGAQTLTPPSGAARVRFVRGTATTLTATAMRNATVFGAVTNPQSDMRVAGLTSIEITADGTYTVLWFIET